MLNWGIVGAGGIASAVIGSIKKLEHSRIIAIASRSNSEQFAREHGIERWYDDYEKMMKDPDVQVVYVATIHPLHYENVMLAIAYGKHVVCEKPMGINAEQTRNMIKAAKARGVFLCEAVWTCFFPAYQKLQELISIGEIGSLQAVTVNFGLGIDYAPEERIFKPAPVGGSVTGMSIYPAVILKAVLGLKGIEPKCHIVMREKTDIRYSLTAKCLNGVLVNVLCGVDLKLPLTAEIYGSEGYIKIPRFLCPDRLELNKNGKCELLCFPLPKNDQGYLYEFSAVQESIMRGDLFCKQVSWEDSIAYAEYTDQISGQLRCDEE
ncbi:Gfo/Idh/MocA family oxidoreductase [Roseburia hominis]